MPRRATILSWRQAGAYLYYLVPVVCDRRIAATQNPSNVLPSDRIVGERPHEHAITGRDLRLTRAEIGRPPLRFARVRAVPGTIGSNAAEGNLFPARFSQSTSRAVTPALGGRSNMFSP
jgi:hypothetical protein